MIPFDDRDGTIWIDGQMVPWKDAKLHMLSHGLHYGSSVFEGERIYNGKIFKSTEHSKRLINSAAILDMKIDLSPEELNAIKEEVCKINNITDGYIRPVAWRGSEMMAISAQHTKIHVAVAAWEWPKYFQEGNTGIRLKTSEWRRPDPATAPVESKAAGIYMIGTIAKHAAERDGYDDVLMLDYKGRVAESSGANIFFVIDGVLKTPIPESFLNGITRQTVMQIASKAGITVQETTIMPEELSQATEVFVTGTAAEITAVGQIDDIKYEVGPITKQIQTAYEKLTRG